MDLGASITGSRYIGLLAAAALIAVGCTASAPVTDSSLAARSTPTASPVPVPAVTATSAVDSVTTEPARVPAEPAASPTAVPTEEPTAIVVDVAAVVVTPEQTTAPAPSPEPDAPASPTPVPAPTPEPSASAPSPAPIVLPAPAPTATPAIPAAPATPTATYPPFNRTTQFVPLNNPRFVSAVERTDLGDDAFVLGLDWNGEQRAYPLSMMAYHHIVNDTVAGEPALITF